MNALLACPARSCAALPSFLLTGAILTGATGAQTEIAFLVGDEPDDSFGLWTASLGDVNADGVPDFGVSAPLGDLSDGRVSVYSGLDGSLLLSVTGSATTTSATPDRIAGVFSVGDLDADGHDDFGTRRFFFGGGFIFSGADASLVAEVEAGVRIGGGIGDLDGDGHSDYLAGDEVRSGADGTTVAHLDLRNGGFARFVGDLNGDGTADYLDIVGGANPNTVIARSGVDHTLLHEVTIATDTYSGPRGLGDVDGDGFDDWGFTRRIINPSSAVDIVSGATGEFTRRLHAKVPAWAAGLGRAGDVDGDGQADFLFFDSSPAPTNPPRLYSGRTGALLAEFIRSDGSFEATSIVGIPDADGDGFAEIVVGSGNSPVAPSDSCSAALYAYDGAAGPNYCAATPNSTGRRAEIRASGTSSLAANHLTLSIHDAPSLSHGLFVMGEARQQVMVGDGVLCVGGPGTPITRLPLRPIDRNGHMLLRLDTGALPNGTAPITAGVTRHFQAWFRDVTPAGAQSNLSDAVTVTFTL